MKKFAIVSALSGLLLAGVLLLLAGLAGSSAPATAGPAGLAPGAADQAGAGLNCRVGMAAWEPALSQVDPAQWGAGWFLDFGAAGPAYSRMEFLRVVRVRQDKYWDGSTWVYSDTFQIIPPLSDAPGGLGPLVAANPGSWWAIGSEPDRGPDPGSPDPGYQDATFPNIYAQAYYSVYHFIRGRDPTARIGPGGLVEVTPGRVQYLDLFWQAYQAEYGTRVPADFWTFHLYILPEANPAGEPNGVANVALGTAPALALRESGGNPALCHDPNNSVYCWADHDDLNLFDQQVRRMRQWMKDHGLQDTPLWLSEWSILYPADFLDEYGQGFPPARVTHWLTATLDYLNTVTDTLIGDPGDGGRLVQRVGWYSLYTAEELARGSNLVTGTASFTFTLPGAALYDYLHAYSKTANLRALAALSTTVRVDPSGVNTVTIGLVGVNNGDVALPFPITVTWYADVSLTVPIASQIVSTWPGCGTRLALTDTWALSGIGTHYYWAAIDPDHRLPEFDEGDNVVRGTVVIVPYSLYLPVLYRTNE
jgi:hypothetical protein